MNPEEIQRQLREAFKIEAEERIASMFENLTALEKSADPDTRSRMLEIVYREAHSLKGAARSVNILPVESICQEMEGLFSRLKNNELAFTPTLFDALHQAVGLVEQYVGAPETDQAPLKKDMEILTAALSDFRDGSAETAAPLSRKARLSDAPGPETETGPQVSRPEKPPEASLPPHPGSAPDAVPSLPKSFSMPPRKTSETVRISTAKLDALLLKAEELITVKQVFSQHLNEIKDALQVIRHWQKISEKSRKELRELRALAHQTPRLLHFFQLYDLNHSQIEESSRRMAGLAKSMDHSSRSLSSMVDDLLEEMKKTALLPFSHLFSLLPRMVRDLSREMGKEVELELTGDEVEIDKRILEGLKDPLIHLIRNALDHGIETPETRKKARKTPWGTIRLSVAQPESNKVAIELFDDGCGIDTARLKQKAVDAGSLDPRTADAMTDADALSLIWLSGLSTSAMITEISGRGLGMAIVQEHVESLNGIISVSTAPGRGTAFKIEVPVSLATFRGLVVSSAGHDFILPIAHVEQTFRLAPDAIRTVGSKSVIAVNGQPVSLVNLADLLGLPLPEDHFFQGSREGRVLLPLVVLGSGQKRIACIVDQIRDEQDVLVKGLGKQLRRVPNLSGATILGDGTVVPILNVNDLIGTAAGRSLPAVMTQAIEILKHQVQKSLLIVEDSFTSRTLLKNILEASGYLVTTAIDGEDGYRRLSTQAFDAVISDVEMPKMNGFELTRKIRETEALASLPVVLITSLDSREDKEKGMDAGADAYIVKSSFDQSNLLEVLERLI